MRLEIGEDDIDLVDQRHIRSQRDETHIKRQRVNVARKREPAGTMRPPPCIKRPNIDKRRIGATGLERLKHVPSLPHVQDMLDQLAIAILHCDGVSQCRDLDRDFQAVEVGETPDTTVGFPRR